jgi:hypothetical protein
VAPPQTRLRAAAEVKPLAQGDLSKLCGLYSVLNAIQLVCWRDQLSRKQLQELHHEGIRYLTKRRVLARVMAMGMDEDVWQQLGDHLAQCANELLGRALVLVPIASRPCPAFASRSAVLTALRRTIALDHPVLCGIGGMLDHYTVVSGISATRVSLFDSSGLKWIEQRNIGSSQQCGTRHWLYGARALVDDW